MEIKNLISETIQRFDGHRSCLMILCLPLDFIAEDGSQPFDVCLIFEVELPENLTGPKQYVCQEDDIEQNFGDNV